MNPALADHPFRFVPHGPDEDFIDLLGKTFALIREDEGVTLVIRAREGDSGPLFARITLQVQSDLELVGLTAAVAGRLASEAIACNVVAGFRHDHLFVPWAQRELALSTLTDLSQDARREP